MTIYIASFVSGRLFLGCFTHIDDCEGTNAQSYVIGTFKIVF